MKNVNILRNFMYLEYICIIRQSVISFNKNNLHSIWICSYFKQFNWWRLLECPYFTLAFEHIFFYSNVNQSRFFFRFTAARRLTSASNDRW